jgi:hypothetical protein
MKSLQRTAGDLLSGGDRYVDLQIDLREWDGVTRITRVGGRWDRQDRCWIGDGESQAVWRVQPAEYEVAYWFADWLFAYCAGKRLEGFEDIYTLLLQGGRDAGKTDIGVRMCAMFAVACRDRIIWDLSPVKDENAELIRNMEWVLPGAWFHWLKSEQTWRLWNGSEIQLLSGYDPSSLKRGRVDMFLMNEGQRFHKDAYLMTRPRLADTSGLGIITANPPRKAIGQWIADFHQGAQSKALRDIHLIEMDNRKNPTVDWRSLELLRDSFGEDDYRREILGEFIPIGDRVFYAWAPSTTHGNVRPMPELGDITGKITRAHLGREFEHVIGMDFQVAPHMAAVVQKFFTNPNDPTDPLQWLVDEAVVEGTEDDLVDYLEAKGYEPATTAIVADASAEWQRTKRDGTQVKWVTSGGGSWDCLRRRGWRNIYTPDRRMKRNPPIIERVQATNARMCSARRSEAPYRRLFSVPENRQTNAALNSWENRSGVPYRRSEFAHLCDAVSYPVWRFFPRVLASASVTYKRIKRKRSERERDLDRF